MPSDRPRRIGRYEIRDRIGQGGMGVLWRAWDPRLERVVAIKQLWTHSDDVRRRFLREASVAAKLQHPHIVTIYDISEHEGQPFIAMEFIAGKTLAEMIRTRTVGTVAGRLQLMIDLCDGLAFAHRAGVVHRDIKPANLMLNEEGELKILDFGIARVMDASLTQDGMTLGTPNYMSPEQVQGQHVDHRSDIFAVGLVLYELLSYRQAFPGESHHMVALRILDDEPEPLLRLMPALDPVLGDIVERCLRKQPDDRYQDLLEMRRDLMGVRDAIERASTEDTVAGLPGALEPQRPPATPAGRFDAGALRRRRQEQIDRHLATAERSLADGKLEDAQEAVEAAATLDPDHGRVVATHERVRAAMGRRQADALAGQARECAASGALTEAVGRLAEAERVHPAPAELADLRREIVGKVEARERERARQRALNAALDRANAARAAGDLDGALAAADEALGRDASDPRAVELRRILGEAHAERQRLEAEARLVAECVASADAALARDDVEAAADAIATCEAMNTHPAVVAARERVGERVALLARRRQEQERREQEAERQRLARTRWVGEQRAIAKSALASGDPDAALAAIDGLMAVEGATPDLAALRTEAITLQNATLRRDQVARLTLDAEAALMRGEPDHAAALLGQAREIDPEDAALEARYGAARRAAEEADARRKAEAHHRAASEAAHAAELEFGRGERVAALERLRHFAPQHPIVTGALVRLGEEAAKLDRLAREQAERQRQEMLDGLARAAVAEADAAFDADEAGALERLRAFVPRHPLVDEAVERLAAAALVRQRERAEAEQRRRAAVLDDRARKAVESARREFEAGRRRPALDTLRSFAPPHPLATTALQELETEDARLVALEEAAAARARAEREARDRAARNAAALVADARTIFEAGRRDEALARLREFDEDPALVAQALQELSERAARLAREEAESAMAAAERTFASGRWDDAVGELRRFSGDSELVAGVLRELTDAAAWRRTRADRIERARASEAAGRWAEAADSLRSILEGDRTSSRPPADSAAVGHDLRRVVRAGWRAALGETAEMVANARWDEADAALRRLDAELSASSGGVVGDPVEERGELRALMTTVAAALTERERRERQRLDEARERERRARARRDLFEAARRDFEAGLAAQALQRLEAAASGDAIVHAASARLASGHSHAANARASATIDAATRAQGPQATARLRAIEAHLARAEALARAGRRRRASAYVGEALAIDPDHAEARAWDAWLRTPAPQPPAGNIRRSVWLLWDGAMLAVRRPGRARPS